MTYAQAKAIIGNQHPHFIANMAKALSLMTWLNTPEDWQRLEAAKIVLRHIRKRGK